MLLVLECFKMPSSVSDLVLILSSFKLSNSLLPQGGAVAVAAGE
jgi:hypothetical protein